MRLILDNLPPSSPDVFDAAKWILLNTPDGPEIEKAAKVILRDHVRSPELQPKRGGKSAATEQVLTD